MSVLANISNLNLHLGHRQIFTEASLTLNKGDKIGLLGLNGFGKSTLFKILTEEISPDISSPEFVYDKSPDLSIFHVPQDLNQRLKQKKGQTPVDFFYSFYPEEAKLKKKIKEVNESLEKNYTDEKLLLKQQKLLEKWQFSEIDLTYQKFQTYLKYFQFDRENAPFETLSGGEKRKLALALGLSAKEEVILWDEPTNHLDLTTLKLFEDELKKSSKTFLLITHDREMLGSLTNRILHISQEKIQSFHGPYESYLLFLEEQEKERVKLGAKLSNRLRRETAWMRQGVKARGTRSKKRVESYHKLQDHLQNLNALKKKKISLSLDQESVKAKQLIKGKNLEISRGEKKILLPSSFTIEKNSQIALIGDNGVGKTSIIKAILNEIPFRGELKIKEGLKITYFSQDFSPISDEITPFDYIGEGGETLSLPSGRNIHLYSYLDDFLFSPEESKRPLHTFSGGERKRLQLAKFLLEPSDFMVFDEPTNDLDLESIAILEEELSKFQGPILLITHDRHLIKNISTECWALEDQKLHIFTAGFEQWEKKKQSEKKEMDSFQKKPSTVEEKNKGPLKLSNKEKQRLRKLPQEIEDKEIIVLQLEEELENFDYSQNDYELVQSLNENLQSETAKLQELYKERERYERKKSV